MEKYKGLIFDLDGVIVDTARFHFLAWKKIADELGISFTAQDNERLKGVSRMASFEIILELGGRSMEEAEKEEWCRRKNDIYVAYIMKLTPDDILPGVDAFINGAKEKGYRCALGSASKNSSLILGRLGISDYFDAIVDGTKVSRAKPDPEVFTRGCQELGLEPRACIVFEDSFSGIEAAHNGGMKAVGVGDEKILCRADIVIPGFAGLDIDTVTDRLGGGIA